MTKKPKKLDRVPWQGHPSGTEGFGPKRKPTTERNDEHQNSRAIKNDYQMWFQFTLVSIQYLRLKQFLKSFSFSKLIFRLLRFESNWVWVLKTWISFFCSLFLYSSAKFPKSVRIFYFIFRARIMFVQVCSLRFWIVGLYVFLAGDFLFKFLASIENLLTFPRAIDWRTPIGNKGIPLGTPKINTFTIFLTPKTRKGPIGLPEDQSGCPAVLGGRWSK